MSRHFNDTIKPEFEDDPLTEWTVQLPPGVPDDPDNNIEDGFLTVKHEDVRAIFAPVINAVLKMVNDQIQAVLKKRETQPTHIAAILLIGGFGESRYLRKRVLEIMNGQIEVLQPPNA
jgi:tRNA A37 threonylcarbamoyltransferase TsaD